MSEIYQSLQDILSRVIKIEDGLNMLAERILKLEEKERQRAREDHDRELSIDQWKEARDKYGTDGC